VRERHKAIWTRISNRDRLCYALVIAFGVCLVVLMSFFQFGYKLGEKEAKPILRQENTTVVTAKILLIDEPNPVVRGIEFAIGVGMIVLGSERLRNYKRRRWQKHLSG